MKKPSYIPQNYDRIQVVDSMESLLRSRFREASQTNVFLYPRPLTENFDALARYLGKSEWVFDGDSYTLLDIDVLKDEIKVMPSALKPATQRIIEDMKCVSRNRDVDLRLIFNDSYNKERIVHDYHIDGSRDYELNTKGRIMCCYNAPTTEILRNDQAKASASGKKYLPIKQAQPFSFRPGDFWRQACDYSSSDSFSGFIHRAPCMKKTDAPRLLLVVD